MPISNNNYAVNVYSKNGVEYEHLRILFVINLCIEFDGDYWHGEERGNKDRDRLREKAIIIENPNIKIYHIKEGDYRENKQVTIDYCVDLIKKELNGIAN